VAKTHADSATPTWLQRLICAAFVSRKQALKGNLPGGLVELVEQTGLRGNGILGDIAGEALK
jgi:hypothetical protein